jgi:hypothetical protein
MDILPERSPSASEEVLYTFKILEIDNAPTNTLSFGLIEFLDAALAQTGANITAPTFLEYDYSPKELANHDNILHLLVRDATPQEDINYYDLAQQLLSSDLLRDHACGLLSAHPCEDKAWLDWLQGTQLLTILPPHPVPASYWARLECNKRKSSEFQPYFICPYADCPNAGQPFLTKRDVLQHLISDHHDLDPDQMTFLDPIKLTDGLPHNEKDEEMEDTSTTTQTYTTQAGSRLQKSSRRSPPLPHVSNTKTKLDMSVAQAASSAYSSTKAAPSTALASSTPSESLVSGSVLYAPPSHPGLTPSLSPPPWPLHIMCIPLPPTILSHCDTFLSQCHPTSPIPHLQDHHASAEIPILTTLFSPRNTLWSTNFTPSTLKRALDPNSSLTLIGPTLIPVPKNATSTTTNAVGIEPSAQGPGDSGLAPIDADTYEFDENLLSVSAIH